jgi:hypothetical protein
MVNAPGLVPKFGTCCHPVCAMLNANDKHSDNKAIERFMLKDKKKGAIAQKAL